MAVMNLPMENLCSKKAEFLDLLDQKLGEQRYQQFLEENTIFVPREFIQNHGVHFDLVIRKMSLAKDYTPDFFYMAKSSATWNLILVEIEKPHSRYFKDNNQLHLDFQTGLDQIARWRAWFENPANKAAFVGHTIRPLLQPGNMQDNPCHVKYVLVHGRREEIQGNELRRGLIRAQEREDFQIISYDSLAEALDRKYPMYVGIRKNEHFDIISPHFIGENLFTWVDPSHLRITDELRTNIIEQKPRWKHYGFETGEYSLNHVLPKLGRCKASAANDV